MLAATHGQHHADTLWKAALVAVLVVVALTLVAAGAAYATQPVSDTHDASLKASATSLLDGLTSRFCNYGSGYNPEQAFRRHYRRLHKKLKKWDAVRIEAAERQRILGEYVDNLLVEHGLVGDNYATPRIKMHIMEVGAQHVYKAQGLTAERALVLTGGWQTDRERAYVALTRALEVRYLAKPCASPPAILCVVCTLSRAYSCLSAPSLL